MTATQRLHDLGQSLWLDNITRDLLDSGNAEAVLARFTAAGIDLDALARKLQVEGAQSFVKSWAELMQNIAEKSAALATS